MSGNQQFPVSTDTQKSIMIMRVIKNAGISDPDPDPDPGKTVGTACEEHPLKGLDI